MRSRRTVGIFDRFLELGDILWKYGMKQRKCDTLDLFFFPKLSSVFSNGCNDKNERRIPLICMAQPLQVG